VLLELRVENYAVIDSVVVEFAPGLNLLTGETGAGKSILIDALALLLGEKASSDVIRHGTDKALVSAVFELEEAAEAKAVTAILGENGLDFDGEQVILRREILPGGRGRVFVCNQPATVTVLKQLAPVLASVHAQRESILSFDEKTRLELLDRYAGGDRQPTEAVFARWKDLRDRIESLESDEQDRLRMLDLWSFQRKEITEVNPQSGEDEKLGAEKRILANAEKIYGAAQAAHEALYESDMSAASLIRAGYKQVQEVAKYDEKFRESLAQLDAARIAVEDIGSSLRDYAESVNVSPERLAEVEDRLAALDRLKRKYGQTLDEVIAYGVEVSRKLHEMENKDETLRKLRKELAEAGSAYLTAARALSKQRFEAARKLEKVVEAEVNDLAMKARVKVEVSGGDEEGNWSQSGFDQVQYLIATNPGEPLRPLEEIASGGELSRVMLALKVAVEAGKSSKKRVNAQRTLVFDEIDIGIGGRAAEAVGRKLKTLAQSTQVLCITHLPQIASFADHHYLIEKTEASGRTRTSIKHLSDAGRREELARMLSGATLTDASRKHAEQMLKTNA
jgi:DNA repair protein RecN (Recombination protein N)